jgi:hypothetical protein
MQLIAEATSFGCRLRSDCRLKPVFYGAVMLSYFFT